MGRHENIQGPYSPESLARRWDVSAETIRQMTHRGELPSFRVGRNIRIPCDIVPVRDQWFVDQQGGIVGCRKTHFTIERGLLVLDDRAVKVARTI